LLGDAEDVGAVIAYGTRATAAYANGDGLCVMTSAGEIDARLVVNAARIFATNNLAMIGLI
jgi:glycine/D-amino acid oxidase-like deaminating enzyme